MRASWSKATRVARYALENPDDVLERGAPPPPTPRKVHNLLPPGYLRKGYGGSKYWPFGIKQAVQEPGYLKGVIAASNNPAYNSVWRYETKRRLEMVYAIIERRDLMLQAYDDMKILDADDERQQWEQNVRANAEQEMWDQAARDLADE